MNVYSLTERNNPFLRVFRAVLEGSRSVCLTRGLGLRWEGAEAEASEGERMEREVEVEEWCVGGG